MSTTAETPVPERSAMPAARPGPDTPRPAPLRPARFRRIPAAVVGVLALALLVGVAPRLARRKAVAAVVAANALPPMVRVARVDTAPGPSSVTLPGNVASSLVSPIYARATGYIDQMRVDIGSRVRKGDLLARIDAPDLDHQVQQARAKVTLDSANLKLARVELVRWKQMIANDSAVTQEQVDQKQDTFDVSVATLNSDIAYWRQLATLQAYERVVAPFDGIITGRNVNSGDLVGSAGSVNGSLASGQSSTTGSLFQLERIDTLRIYVTVPEDNAAGVAVGRPALVSIPALPGDTLRGQVVRTSNALDPAARTLLAEVDVANPKGTYLPGSYAQVRLTLAQAGSVLQLPATALVIRAGPPQVVTVGPDSTAQFRTVTVGRDYGSWVEVTAGLERGAKIVLNPPDGLQPGQRVRALSSATPNGG
jgi:membrane fusion protein (multidrug efflux system)